MESWKQVEGYPHLFVSNEGRVWTRTYNRFLRTHLTNRGYLRVNLSKDKTVKQVSVHRLVAETFIPNPEGLTDVDHIDGDKLNNKAENLQWISRSDNIKKAGDARNNGSKPVICVETGKVYESVNQASREMKIPVATISAIARGEYGSYHNLHFGYYNGEDKV